MFKFGMSQRTLIARPVTNTLISKKGNAYPGRSCGSRRPSAPPARADKMAMCEWRVWAFLFRIAPEKYALDSALLPVKGSAESHRFVRNTRTV